MYHLEYARDRLGAFVREIEVLEDGDFPHSHSLEALKRMREYFHRRLGYLDRLDEKSNPGLVLQECGNALVAIFEYLPLLGFILRSTNVRNAFEEFRPLLRLAQQLLQGGHGEPVPETFLILSSEWDYSPFVYREIRDLPRFVLIGLPAPESSNPLLVPLAGHELGHVLWAGRKLEESFRAQLDESVLSLVRNRWEEYSRFVNVNGLQAERFVNGELAAYPLLKVTSPIAAKQAEELFADFVGIKLFGGSFFQAFAYLLFPGLFGERSTGYPLVVDRVAYQVKAGQTYGVTAPEGYAALFLEDNAATRSEYEGFLLEIIDTAIGQVVDSLICKAGQLVDDSGVPELETDEERRILQRFKMLVPAEGCKSLGDILNAGWQAYNDPSFWEESPEVSDKRKDILKELILKTLEVMEIDHILGKSI